MSSSLTLREVSKHIQKHLLFDKGIWKWCAIFTGLYLGSRFFFYRFYYPSILRIFTPPSFFELGGSDNHNNHAKQAVSHQSSISNAFPQSLLRRLSIQGLHSESLYSSTTRWIQSNKASGKLMSLTHAVLTVYKGIRIMSTFGINSASISRGVDFIQPPVKTDHPLVCDMVNMNTAYVVTDLLLIYAPNPHGSTLFIAHHLVVFFAGVLLKSFNEGSPAWILIYWYSDIPTIIFHSLWFFRNIGLNLESLYSLFKKNSVKQSEYLQGYADHDEAIIAKRKTIDKVEKVLFLGFSASFFYVRLVVFSRVLPAWLYHSWKSENWSTASKYAATGVVAGLLGVGYAWSFGLGLKIREVLSAEKVEEDEEVHSQPEQNEMMRVDRLSSVEEEEDAVVL